VALRNYQSFHHDITIIIMNRTLSVDSKEKPVISHVENSEGLKQTESNYAYNGADDGGYREYDKAFEKRVIRKVDIRLLIILGALYSIALIDRTNLSAARVAGMAKDLKL
jgi:hypothetical protein